MKETEHTPGAWRIGTPPPNGEQTIGTQNGLMVAVATTGAGTPTKANARLIAAAPELLEALQEVELVFAEKLRPLGADPNVSPMTHRIRAAIAKATGGSRDA